MCGREAPRVAPTHLQNIEFEFKGSRKTRLVTGNVVDFILGEHGAIFNFI